MKKSQLTAVSEKRKVQPVIVVNCRMETEDSPSNLKKIFGTFFMQTCFFNRFFIYTVETFLPQF